MSERFLRTESIIGQKGLEKLRNSKVAVFGIGGVGSYSLETLVRSGIGTVYIFDNDTVAMSNINRQIIALDSTVGKYKTEIANKRCKDINPDVNIIENRIFVTPEANIDFGKFDFVIDAVDNVTAKLYIISECNKLHVPIISVMGTGNKLDPSRIRITDIYKTTNCPLARVMRRELKKRSIKSLNVVWSDEPAIVPLDCGEYKSTGRITPGSMPIVPSISGITAAYFIIKNIIK